MGSPQGERNLYGVRRSKPPPTHAAAPLCSCAHLNITNQGSTGQGSTGQGSTGQGSTGQGSTSQGSTGQGKHRSGEYWSGEYRSGEHQSGEYWSGEAPVRGSTGQGSTGQGGAGQGSTRQGSTSTRPVLTFGNPLVYRVCRTRGIPWSPCQQLTFAHWHWLWLWVWSWIWSTPVVGARAGLAHALWGAPLQNFTCTAVLLAPASYC